MMRQAHKVCAIYLMLLSCTVQSDRIIATINDKYKVNLTENIDGHNITDIRVTKLTLNQLLDQPTLPTLSISNVALKSLTIIGIPLETVPVFTNVTISVALEIDGSQIQTVPAYAFDIPNLYDIELTNGELATVEASAFSSDLLYLNMRCNKLTSFSETWFQNPQSIAALILSGNSIQHIQEKAFNSMTTLSRLELDRNGITKIDGGAFGFSVLMLLNLRFNNISQLPNDVFSADIVAISNFYIDYNQLTFLADDLLDKLKVRDMSLDGNPWQCPCLRATEKWIRETNAARRYMRVAVDEPVCVVARSFPKVCVPYVDRELQRLYMDSLTPLTDCFTTKCGGCNDRLVRYVKRQ